MQICLCTANFWRYVCIFSIIQSIFHMYFHSYLYLVSLSQGPAVQIFLMHNICTLHTYNAQCISSVFILLYVGAFLFVFLHSEQVYSANWCAVVAISMLDMSPPLVLVATAQVEWTNPAALKYSTKKGHLCM